MRRSNSKRVWPESYGPHCLTGAPRQRRFARQAGRDSGANCLSCRSPDSPSPSVMVESITPIMPSCTRLRQTLTAKAASNAMRVLAQKPLGFKTSERFSCLVKLSCSSQLPVSQTLQRIGRLTEVIVHPIAVSLRTLSRKRHRVTLLPSPVNPHIAALNRNIVDCIGVVIRSAAIAEVRGRSGSCAGSEG